MNIKNLFFLVCLLAATLLEANNHPISVASAASSSLDGGPCNLPAPLNFQITEVGPTWVRYGWGGNANAQHRIRTYRASDNALLNTTIVPIGNADAVVDNLPNGTEVYGIINAICTDGNHSINEAQCVPVITVILELIVTGVQPPEGEVNGCTLTTTGYCPFSGAQVTSFRISNLNRPYSSRIFGMKFGGYENFQSLLEKNNSEDPSLFDFRCQNILYPEPNCDTQTEFEIWFTGVTPAVRIATFYPSLLDQTTYKLNYTSLTSGYKLERLNSYRPAPSITATGRDGSDKQNALSAAVSPNPFSESLEVFLAPNAEKIHLQLYNLSGQKVLDQKFTGGQDQYSLPTAALSPGFYLLRVEADGEVQTLKVIKSE